MIDDFRIFIIQCVKDFKLNIIGLMCLPPNANIDPSNYFEKMKKLAKIIIK